MAPLRVVPGFSLLLGPKVSALSRSRQTSWEVVVAKRRGQELFPWLCDGSGRLVHDCTLWNQRSLFSKADRTINCAFENDSGQRWTDVRLSSFHLTILPNHHQMDGSHPIRIVDSRCRYTLANVGTHQHVEVSVLSALENARLPFCHLSFAAEPTALCCRAQCNTPADKTARIERQRMHVIRCLRMRALLLFCNAAAWI